MRGRCGTDNRMENDEEVVDMCKAWSDMAPVNTIPGFIDKDCTAIIIFSTA